MIAIIPCAGRGTRRRPETEYLPKILLTPPSVPPQAGGRRGEYQAGGGDPLIEHIVRPIDMSERFEKLVFVLSLKHGQQVIDYIHRNPFETPVSFVWQHEPLGFGHAVLQAREEALKLKVGKWESGKVRKSQSPLHTFSPSHFLRSPPVLIHTDDAINRKSGENGKSLIESITASDVSQIGVQWRGNVRNYGMVITGEARERGSEGARKKPVHLPRQNSPTRMRVERVIEKPYWDEGGLCMTGIYYIRESRRLFRCLSKLVKMGRCLGGEYQFTHALQMMIDAGTPFQTHYHDWVDCGQVPIHRDARNGTRKREDGKTGKREGSLVH